VGILKSGGFAMVFISYSWDSDEHIKRVSQLVKLLKKSGIQVVWDQDLALGKRIPSFMEESLQKCGQVLFICTPNYKQKADGRDGGVGFETNVITGDLYRNYDDVKYIPVLFEGDWDNSMPIWASGKLGADLRKENMREYDKLLDALGDWEEVDTVPEEEFGPEMNQPPEEPAGPEECRVLEQIYQELLEVKTWLVGLESKADGSMEDPTGSEDKMWEKEKSLRRMKDTYDFLLKENVLESLDKFFRYWRYFAYYYTHFEEETAKNASKKQGFLSSLFSVSVSERLWDYHKSVRNACNAALSAIARRLSQH